MNPTSTPWETTAGSSARVHAVSSTAHHGGVIGSGGGTIAGAGTLSAADETMAGAAVSGTVAASGPGSPCDGGEAGDGELGLTRGVARRTLGRGLRRRDRFGQVELWHALARREGDRLLWDRARRPGGLELGGAQRQEVAVDDRGVVDQQLLAVG